MKLVLRTVKAIFLQIKNFAKFTSSTDMSSPAFTSYDSPESAYIQQNRPGFTSLDPQNALRLTTLQRPPPQSRTTTRPFRESVGPEDSPENRDNVVCNELPYPELKRHLPPDPILQLDHLPESRSAEGKPTPRGNEHPACARSNGLSCKTNLVE